MGTKPLIVLSVIILVGVFVFVSFRADLRLRDDMPAQFVSLDGVAQNKRANEESIARAYWNCARLVLTPKYNLAYNLPLPVEPPPEFNVSCENAGPKPPPARQPIVHKIGSDIGNNFVPCGTTERVGGPYTHGMKMALAMLRLPSYDGCRA